MDQEQSLLIQAWIETRASTNHTLVALSASGIGLMITIASLLDGPHIWTIYALAGAVLCFLLGVGAGLVIMHLNADLLQEAIHKGSNASGSSTDNRIRRLRQWLWASFLLGVLFAVAGTGIHVYPTVGSHEPLVTDPSGPGSD